jgi:hypothetical protein
MERYDMTTVSVFGQLRTRLLSQQWFNTLLYGMPRPVRWALRAAYFAPLDFADYLSGRRDTGNTKVIEQLVSITPRSVRCSIIRSQGISRVNSNDPEV